MYYQTFLTLLEDVRNFVYLVSWCVQQNTFLIWNAKYHIWVSMFSSMLCNEIGSKGHPVLFTQAHNVVVIEMTGIPSDDLWQPT